MRIAWGIYVKLFSALRKNDNFKSHKTPPVLNVIRDQDIISLYRELGEREKTTMKCSLLLISGVCHRVALDKWNMMNYFKFVQKIFPFFSH